MIFSSFSFLVFLVATLAVYSLARTTRERAAVMLAASLVFYASWRPAYLLLLGASLAFNYALYSALQANRSRRLLVLAVVLNLALLGVAKYLAFLVETAFALAGIAGLTAPRAAPDWMHWALPLGVSFYTFHMLSAMFDACSGVWSKPVSFARWCLYVTFFPHLIAGPILRPGQLIDQLGELQPLEASGFKLGGAIFVGGLIKKAIIADNLAPIADAAYAHPSALGAGAAWIGTLAFAFQIYFDFSGYSEMAIGLARLFGVQLPRNFLYPYLARNPSDFWRRWHITLSAWLRDYLYIGLGGSRGSTGRTYVNLMLTMLLGGLWHGASWTFVVWGGLHGAYLVGHRLLVAALTRWGLGQTAKAQKALSNVGVPLTFLLVLVTWVFFRAASFGDAWMVLAAMTGLQDPSSPLAFRRYEMLIVATAAALAWAEPVILAAFERRGIGFWWRVPYPLRGVAYAVLTLLIVAFGGATQKFIYFDF
ncbi:MAG TPA: MBOAT family O-acyltransferase [Burkholderiaceae bacterium]|nr:MBOAT family O-acyltransferase [Burkholderiaceae bacterium]